MNQSKSIRRELVPPWAVVVFAVLMIALVIGVFAIQNAMKLSARRAILSDLDRLESYNVTLDGRMVGDGTTLVPLLKDIRLVAAHHSEPTNPIRVRIADASNAPSTWSLREILNVRTNTGYSGQAGTTTRAVLVRTLAALWISG